MKSPSKIRMIDHTDKEQLKVKRVARVKIAELLEYGTEEDFVAAVKSWKPDLTPKELKEWVMLFRDAKNERVRSR